MDTSSPKLNQKTGNKRSRSPTDDENNSPNKQRAITIDEESSNSRNVNSIDEQQDKICIESNEAAKEFIQNKWASLRRTSTRTGEEKKKDNVVVVDKDTESHDATLKTESNSTIDCAKHHKCEICHHEIFLPKDDNPKENLIEFQKHLLIHTNKALFGEIPFLDKYYCPNPITVNHPTSSKESDGTKQTCNASFDDRQDFLLHLCNHHDEFFLRINRRLRETGDTQGENGQHNQKLKEEYDQLKAVKRSMQNKNFQEKFDYTIPNISFGQSICTENELLDVYEKEHRLGNPDQFLHCKYCPNVFKNIETSIVHLLLEHSRAFNDRLKGIPEQEDELAFKNVIEMLSWNNNGSFSTRVSYCCPFGSCSFGKCVGNFKKS